MDLIAECAAGCKALALSLPQERVLTLVRYVELLAKWNKTYNLTAVRDPHEMLFKHVLDSLSIIPFVKEFRVLDIGTGGGLPGIPIAIACPQLQVTLLDSVAKKTTFLTQAVYDLQLSNVTVVNARLEDFRPEISFNTIVSRAFSTINVMLSSAERLLCDQGRMLAMKGVYPVGELQEVSKSSWLASVHALTIPGVNAERHIVWLERNPCGKDYCNYESERGRG